MTVARSNRYAYGTQVPVAKSKSDIEAVLKRYGATAFMYGADSTGRAQIMFEAKGRRVRFELPSPKLTEPRAKFSETAFTKEERRLWRSLLMAVKSKLDVVESGIASFETEFLAYTMLDNGRTFAEAAHDEKFVARLASGNHAPIIALPGGQG